MTVQILRAAERVARPWKNGGGETFEVAVFPDGADMANFDWRISLATVTRAGPFSAFPGVDRLMLVLDGRLELQVAGSERLVLDPASPAASFPGDVDVLALTPENPVTDCNVMVRRGSFTASLARRDVAGAVAVVCQDVTLILCSAPAAAGVGAQQHELEAYDVIRIDGMRGALARLRLTGEIAIAHINAPRR